MSQVKKAKWGLLIVFIFMSFFMFGCDKSVPVNDIHFDLTDGKQIVLMVGQTLDMKDRIVITPSYATNQHYTLTSFNEDIVGVQNKSLVAVSEGATQIRIVSEDNELKEDLMTVIVKKTKTTLNAPLNLKYDNSTQSFSFDAVTYASSYTFKIDGEEFDLGNSTVFNLSQYRGQAYDRPLVVQVKANAPSYTYALEGSRYSEEYKIYQAGELKNVEVKAGVLSFEKTVGTIPVNIYFNNELQNTNKETSRVVTVSLKTLEEKYSNTTMKVGVQAIIDQSIKDNLGNEIEYFDSIRKEIDLKVIEVPEITFGVGEISWQNILYVGSYDIYVDGKKCAETTDSYFDLSKMANYDKLLNEDSEHEIKVEAQIASDAINIGRSKKSSSIRVKRLRSTTIKCEGTRVCWDGVEDALYYNVSLFNTDQNEVFLTAFSTTLLEHDMAEMGSGNYKISVQAVADVSLSGQGIYYVASKSVELAFNKLASIKAEIKNYKLRISNLGTGSCEADFDVDDFDMQVKGTGGLVEINLADLTFPAGHHSIVLKRAGDEDSIESDSTVLEFTQLEKITEIKIEDGEMFVDLSDANNGATIRYTVTGGTLVTPFWPTGRYKFNTTNPGEMNFLGAGEYEVGVQVIGDGTNTFSYRESGVVVECATRIFYVLDIPTAEVKDSSKSEFEFVSMANVSKYGIYKIENGVPEFANESETVICDFELESGTCCFGLQAIGDGSNYLNSCISEPVVVTRLESPTLKYNSATKIVSYVEPNNADLVAGHVLTQDGDMIEYDFLSPMELKNSTTLAYKTIAVVKKDDVYYLNSWPNELKLTKISSDVNISLNDDNNIVIDAVDHEAEYLLKVVINDGVNVYNLNSEGGKLIGDGVELEYEYTDNKYIIEIIKDFNIIIDDLNESFNIKVEFIHQSTGDDSVINSEPVDADLEFVNLNNLATITIDEHNRIVIKSEIEKECGLIIKIIGNSVLTFVGNGDKLVSNHNELDYYYEDGSYYITILDELYNAKHIVFKDDFSINVIFTHNKDANVTTDLDSGLSDVADIDVQDQSLFERLDQALEFEKTKETHTCENYMFIVENLTKGTHFFMELTESVAVAGDGVFSVEVEHIYDMIATDDLLDVYAVSVVTLKESSSLTVSRRGEHMLIQKAEALIVDSAKDNNGANNSVVIKLKDFESRAYLNYKHVFEIFSKEGEFETIRQEFDFVTDVDNIKFNLDDIANLSGNIYIHAYIETQSLILGVETSYEDNGKTIQVFNSDNSNELKFEKLQPVEDLYVQDNVLTFSAAANAVGYEIYHYDNSGKQFIKLNTSLVTTNRYVLNLDEATRIYVKAISKDNGYTNSNQSEEISVQGISIESVSVEEGLFKIQIKLTKEIVESFDKKEDIIKLTPVVKNGANYSDINFNNAIANQEIKLKYTNEYLEMVCEPSLVLQYAADGETSMLAESIGFKIKVQPAAGASDDVYYLNSNEMMVDSVSYGLFKPKNIVKNSNGVEGLESISWENDPSNGYGEENIGYIFKIVYASQDGIDRYYSSDTNLKYYNKANGTYESYVSATNKYIENPIIVFPAGYDTNSDGMLDVFFEAGTYRISVQAVPMGIEDGKNICRSKYSKEFEFEILEKPEVKAMNGNLIWEKVNAEKYQITFYNKDTDEIIVTEEVSRPEYNFTNKTGAIAEMSGIIKVEVRALGGGSDNVLNSVPSDPIYIYKLPMDSTIKVDDGYLVLESIDLFSEAFIEFVSDDVTYNVRYQNPVDVKLKLIDLGITTQDGMTTKWKDATGTIGEEVSTKIKIDELAGGRDYIIKVTLIGYGNDLLIVSSSKQTQPQMLNVTKLNPNKDKLNLGSVKYYPDEQYATYENVFTSNVTLNYSFNETMVDADSFWNNKTVIYKIKVSHSGTETYIYAVDYYSFIKEINSPNKTLSDGDYEILPEKDDMFAYVKYTCADGEVLYFNVYKENTISLQYYDSIRYYAISETFENGRNKLVGVSTGEIDIKNIDLTKSDDVTFTIDVSMMGGDSFERTTQTFVGCLSSNSSTTHKFVKYSKNELSVYKGKLQFRDLLAKVKNEAGNGFDIIDYPIYRLEARLNNNNEINKLFYLYYEGMEDDAREIAAKFDAQSIDLAEFYQVEIDEDHEGYLYFDLSNYINPTQYKLSILTLAGKGVGGSEENYRLNATIYADKTINKWTNVDFEIKDGYIEFAQSKFESIETYYCTNYEVKITNTSGYDIIYYINETSEGVTFKDYKVRYALPGEIPFDGGTLVLDENKDYKIDIKAMCDQYDTININGSYSEESTVFKKAKTFNNVRIEQGVLKWNIKDGDEFNGAQILILVYNKSDKSKVVGKIQMPIVASKVGNDYTYTFEDIQYPLTNVTGQMYLTSDYDYVISVCHKGNSSSVVDSNYITVERPVQRLEKVQKIETTDGLLTWNAVDGAICYEVILTGAQSLLVRTENNETSLDIGSLLSNSGIYSVRIRAIGSQDINSMLSDEVDGFVQLGAVDQESISITGSAVVWNKVYNAVYYKLLINYTDGDGEPAEFETEIEDTNSDDVMSYSLNFEFSGTYTITITPIGKANDKKFNGKPAVFEGTKSRPNTVAGVNYDSNSNEIVVNVDTDDFRDKDEIKITYKIAKYSSAFRSEDYSYMVDLVKNQMGYSSDFRTISYDKNNSTGEYRLKLTEMAYYFEIFVEVTRPGTLSSYRSSCEAINLDLFSYGAGVEDNTYVVNTEDQFFNIKHYSSSRYLLGSGINLSAEKVISKLTENGTYVIANEFSGIIDGDEKNLIIDGEIKLQNAKCFALFGKLTGTIKDLIVGDTGKSIILSNTFGNNLSSVINLSLIAIESEGATLSNIEVQDYKIKVTTTMDKNKLGSMYVGGLLGISKRTTITGIKIHNIEVSIEGMFTRDYPNSLQVGGIVSDAVRTKIENSYVSLKLSSRTILDYVGGAVAYWQDSSPLNSNYGIFNTTVVFNSDATAYNLGGIVGFAKYILIDNSSVSGEYSAKAISCDVNIGGIVGLGNGITINESGSNVDFSKVSIGQRSENQWFGGIVGKLEGSSSEITQCYCYNIAIGATSISVDKIITMGIYGKNSSGVEIDCEIR